jgi:hypothetical protein
VAPELPGLAKPAASPEDLARRLLVSERRFVRSAAQRAHRLARQGDLDPTPTLPVPGPIGRAAVDQAIRDALDQGYLVVQAGIRGHYGLYLRYLDVLPIATRTQIRVKLTHRLDTFRASVTWQSSLPPSALAAATHAPSGTLWRLVVIPILRRARQAGHGPPHAYDSGDERRGAVYYVSPDQARDLVDGLLAWFSAVAEGVRRLEDQTRG